jgi:Ca2+:H+ antiporter
VKQAALISEWPIALAVVTAAVVYALEHALLESGAAAIGLTFTLIVAVIVTVSFRVAHHAEVLAERFGEPYGTMILTSAAVIVEVVMLAILMSNSHQPTLARDTVFAAVMIDINGIIGIAAIIGGIRHGEQKYNLDASNSYIAMLLVALGISMFLPDFVPVQAWQVYSIFTIVVMVILYAVFLRIQTVEHRYFFRYGKSTAEEGGHVPTAAQATRAAVLLVGSVVVIGVLAELLSVLLEPAETLLGLPKALPAVMIAVISASPEILTAVRAAQRDEMQTVINIALGASLATVLLTVPVIETVALMQGSQIDMGITPVQAAMLLLTLLAAMINLHDGESNVLEGAVLFALFATFVALTFIV